MKKGISKFFVFSLFHFFCIKIYMAKIIVQSILFCKLLFKVSQLISAKIGGHGFFGITQDLANKKGQDEQIIICGGKGNPKAQLLKSVASKQITLYPLHIHDV